MQRQQDGTTSTPLSSTSDSQRPPPNSGNIGTLGKDSPEQQQVLTPGTPYNMSSEIMGGNIPILQQNANRQISNNSQGGLLQSQGQDQLIQSKQDISDMNLGVTSGGDFIPGRAFSVDTATGMYALNQTNLLSNLGITSNIKDQLQQQPQSSLLLDSTSLLNRLNMLNLTNVLDDDDLPPTSSLISQIQPLQKPTHQTIEQQHQEESGESQRSGSSSSSGGMSRLQDQMFSKLLRNQTKIPDKEESLQQMYSAGSVGGGEIPPTSLLQALIIQDPTTALCIPSSQGGAGSNNSKTLGEDSDNDEPAVIVSHEEDEEEENSPKEGSYSPSQLNEAGGIEEVVTQFDQQEHQQLMHQYHKLRLQKLENPQSTFGGESETTTQQRTMSIETGASTTNQIKTTSQLSKNNLFAFSNESQYTQFFGPDSQHNTPAAQGIRVQSPQEQHEEIVSQATSPSPDSLSPRVIQMRKRAAGGVDSATMILQQIKEEGSSFIIGTEGQEEEKKSSLSMREIIDDASSSSSDSFTALSTDIQNVIKADCSVIASNLIKPIKTLLEGEDQLTTNRHHTVENTKDIFRFSIATGTGLLHQAPASDKTFISQQLYFPAGDKSVVYSDQANMMLHSGGGRSTSVVPSGTIHFQRASPVGSQNQHSRQHNSAASSMSFASSGKQQQVQVEVCSQQEIDTSLRAFSSSSYSMMQSQQQQQQTPTNQGVTAIQQQKWSGQQIPQQLQREQQYQTATSIFSSDNQPNQQQPPVVNQQQPWWQTYQQNLMQFEEDSSSDMTFTQSNTGGGGFRKLNTMNDTYQANSSFKISHAYSPSFAAGAERRPAYVASQRPQGPTQNYSTQAVYNVPQSLPSYQHSPLGPQSYAAMGSIPQSSAGQQFPGNVPNQFQNYQRAFYPTGAEQQPNYQAPYTSNPSFIEQQHPYAQTGSPQPQPAFYNQAATIHQQQQQAMDPSLLQSRYHPLNTSATATLGSNPSYQSFSSQVLPIRSVGYSSANMESVAADSISNNSQTSSSLTKALQNTTLSGGSASLVSSQQPPSLLQPLQSIALINQTYKTIVSEDQKLAFLITNSYLLSKDQAGCRRLQKKIDEQIEKNSEKGRKFAHDMLSNLLPQAGELMMDSFANYLIQKLNKLALDQQIEQLFIMIQPCFVQVANNKHGTRALQNLFKHIVPLSDKKSQLISEGFRPTYEGEDKVLNLALNLHGNHVVQLCLDHLTKEEHKQRIYNTVLCNCAKIATDKHGCCVIQKLLGGQHSSIQNALVNVSLAQLDSLINDQFGNYVVQQILKYNNQEINLRVAQFICDNFTYYCTQKISSNVVESAVRSHSSPQSQALFFNYLLQNQRVFREVTFDQFGNYVINAILQQAKEYGDGEKYFQELLKIFVQWTDELSKVSFGKKFIAKIQGMSPQQFALAQMEISKLPTEETKQGGIAQPITIQEEEGKLQLSLKKQKTQQNTKSGAKNIFPQSSGGSSSKNQRSAQNYSIPLYQTSGYDQSEQQSYYQYGQQQAYHQNQQQQYAQQQQAPTRSGGMNIEFHQNPSYSTTSTSYQHNPSTSSGLGYSDRASSYREVTIANKNQGSAQYSQQQHQKQYQRQQHH